MSWLRMNEGLNDELGLEELISKVDDQVDLRPGGVLIEAHGSVTGVADGGHRQVLLVARDTGFLADVPSECLARPGRGRLQRRQRPLGRSDRHRTLEFVRK